MEHRAALEREHPIGERERDIHIVLDDQDRGAADGALARSLALDLAPVRVNCVSPGIIDTPIRAAMPEAARREMLEKTTAALPVRRVGLGEDIARQIVAFMTNGFATGSILYLDGGGLVA